MKLFSLMAIVGLSLVLVGCDRGYAPPAPYLHPAPQAGSLHYGPAAAPPGNSSMRHGLSPAYPSVTDPNAPSNS